MIFNKKGSIWISVLLYQSTSSQEYRKHIGKELKGKKRQNSNSEISQNNCWEWLPTSSFISLETLGKWLSLLKWPDNILRIRQRVRFEDSVPRTSLPSNTNWMFKGCPKPSSASSFTRRIRRIRWELLYLFLVMVDYRERMQVNIGQRKMYVGWSLGGFQTWSFCCP